MADSDYEEGTVEVRGKRVPATRIVGTNWVYRDRRDRESGRIKGHEVTKKVALTFTPNP